MKNTLKLFALILFTLYFTQNCKKSDIGKITSYSECKYNDKSVYVGDDYGSDTTCVKYSYDKQNNKLSIEHINSSFNCCPGDLLCDIEVSNDTIYITEKSEKEECSCMCLFDLEMEVFSIKSKSYHIIVNEPYIGTQQKIAFDVDLSSTPVGEFCIGRGDYPWGI